MTSRFRVPGVLAVVATAAIGCAPGAPAERLAGRFSPALVMAPAPETAAWEYGRNDERLNAGQTPIAGAGWTETRSRDLRRTANGRPHEYSSDLTRTVTRRLSY